MIVRVMGEGQWRVDDELAGRLNELDDEVGRALERRRPGGDERRARGRCAELVKREGTPPRGHELRPRTALVPPERPDARRGARAARGRGLDPGPARPECRPARPTKRSTCCSPVTRAAARDGQHRARIPRARGRSRARDRSRSCSAAPTRARRGCSGDRATATSSPAAVRGNGTSLFVVGTIVLARRAPAALVVPWGRSRCSRRPRQLGRRWKPEHIHAVVDALAAVLERGTSVVEGEDLLAERPLEGVAVAPEADQLARAGRAGPRRAACGRHCSPRSTRRGGRGRRTRRRRVSTRVTAARSGGSTDSTTSTARS